LNEPFDHTKVKYVDVSTKYFISKLKNIYERLILGINTKNPATPKLAG